MSVVGLLKRQANPTEEQLEESITGNLCRCTGYASIRRAAHRAAELSSPLVGKSGPQGRDGGQ
jgi:carbon-monoxide dehydrogenase small subunit